MSPTPPYTSPEAGAVSVLNTPHSLNRLHGMAARSVLALAGIFGMKRLPCSDSRLSNSSLPGLGVVGQPGHSACHGGHMDPATLALTAAGLLAKKALEAAAGKAGEGAWAGLGRLREAIWAKFRGDPEATEALERLEAKPDSQARTAELAEVLQPRLEAEPQLVAELTRLVEEAKAEPQAAAFVTTVQDNARVGKLTNIGQITGDVHL
jgi:hypothetical protein